MLSLTLLKVFNCNYFTLRNILFLSDTCKYQEQTVQCVSENKAYTECSLGPAGMGVKSVTLLKQDSAEQCVYSAVYNAGEEKGAFGYYNYDMWTYQGCGGVFEYCYECKYFLNIKLIY